MDLLDEKVQQIYTEATALYGVGITATASVHRALVSVISALSTEEIDAILECLDERNCVCTPGRIEISKYYYFDDEVISTTEAVLGLKRHLIHSSVRPLIGRL